MKILTQGRREAKKQRIFIKLDYGKRIDRLASALRHRRYTPVQVTAADGNKTTYYVRQTTGRLEKVPLEVRIFFSKRHPREKSPAYFMSTDLTSSAQQALQGYKRS